jgi:class 3 adenylate cyclase
MAVAGLHTPGQDHAAAVAELALAARAQLREFAGAHGAKLQMRIGIHTGAAVGGVIGIKRFAFDLWGDAINVASRMESHGLPGEIQVSEAAYAALRERYALEPRGTIKVKGKGEMAVYILKGRKGAPAGASVPPPGGDGA